MNQRVERRIGQMPAWMYVLLAALLAKTLVPRAWSDPAVSAATAGKSTVILDENETNWRWFKTWRPAVIIDESNSPERLTIYNKKIDAKAADTMDVAVPAGFAAVDFDDSQWSRTAGRWLDPVAFQANIQETRTIASTYFQDPNITLLILRGKFTVTDAAAVKSLTLSLEYRGGVVVYLNGKEVARRDLPSGQLSPVTPATPYPAEAYVDADGRLLPGGGIKPQQKDDLQRAAKRDRSMDNLALPVDQLRKGSNVLVIEAHRSDYQPAAHLGASNEKLNLWGQCAVMDIDLSADGGGIVPNISRPAGLQTWNQDVNDRTTVADYGDPNESLQPILITGARNGVFSGKVVVSSDKAMEKIGATIGDLKQVGGAGVISAASALQIQYSVATPTMFNYRSSPWVEPLSVTAPETVACAIDGGAVQPVWLWVRVPKDAAAGDYQGTLSISVAGSKLADVPVRLHIADWSISDPLQFHTFVGILQSPTSLAYQYKVDEWSEKHWALMDKSMELLGELGTQAVEIPVVDETRLGNPEGMVRWLKKPDGTYNLDFSIVDRYLKLVKKHLGAPKFVVFHVWFGGGWRIAGPKQVNTVTVVNADGTHTHLQVPEFGTEESRKFWEPVFKGLKDLLAQEGMQKSLCLGSFGEQYSRDEKVNKMFADLAGPGSQWLQISHNGGPIGRPPRELVGGGIVGYHVFAYLPPDSDASTPQATPSISKTYWPHVAYFRRGQGIAEECQSLISHRTFGLRALFRHLPGFGYMGLDFWPYTPPQGNRLDAIYGRYLRSGSYPGDPSPYYLSWAGPDGAEPMTAYESTREGLQETEALLAISNAIESAPDKLGADLVQRCRQELYDELDYIRTREEYIYQYTFFHTNYYGWQELSARAFALAAEVSHKLGQ